MNSTISKMEGILYHYDFQRGFGFLQTKEESGVVTRWFVHASRIQSGTAQVGALVKFHPGPAARPGMSPQAMNCEIGEVVTLATKILAGSDSEAV